jgi:hypothetical protein
MLVQISFEVQLIQWCTIFEQHMDTVATHRNLPTFHWHKRTLIHHTCRTWDDRFVSSSVLVDIGFVAASDVDDELARRKSIMAMPGFTVTSAEG